jgi:hypothetical protein
MFMKLVSYCRTLCSNAISKKKELSEQTLYVYCLSASDKLGYYELDQDTCLVQLFQFTFSSSYSSTPYHLTNATVSK